MLKRMWKKWKSPAGSTESNDPRRDPNWCWTHNMPYPQCAGMH